MSTAFISDLHLDASRPDLAAALVRWLKEHQTLAALYILGDLFEVWVGDDDDAPELAPIEAALCAASKRYPVFAMHGNRDFLLGREWAQRVGITLLPDPSIVTLYGQRWLLMHGDSLCVDDAEYMAARTMFRDPGWQAGVLAQSLDARRQLAAGLRAQSKAANANKASGIMDVNAAAVDAALAAAETDRMIHGHTHRPAIHRFTSSMGQVERIVLGDWDRYGWAYELDERGGCLCRYPLG